MKTRLIHAGSIVLLIPINREVSPGDWEYGNLMPKVTDNHYGRSYQKQADRAKNDANETSNSFKGAME